MWLLKKRPLGFRTRESRLAGQSRRPLALLAVMVREQDGFDLLDANLSKRLEHAAVPQIDEHRGIAVAEHEHVADVGPKEQVLGKFSKFHGVGSMAGSSREIRTGSEYTAVKSGTPIREVALVFSRRGSWARRLKPPLQATLQLRPAPSMFDRKTSLKIVIAICSLANGPALAQVGSAKNREASQWLLSRELVPSGNVWITRREANLKRAADSLEALKRRHQQAIVKAGEALAVNEAIRAQLAAAEAAKRAKTGQPEPIKREPSLSAQPQTTALAATPPTKLNSQLPDVTGLGEQTPLQQAMIELASARTAVQLTVLAIKRDAPEIESDYLALQTDSRLQAAIKQVNSNARLGPARNYQRELARVDAIGAGAFRQEIPGYLESGQFRVSGILNESQPVTFNFHTKDGPLLLAASVVQRLGLADKDITESPREIVVAGRRVMARPVKLASLRLGLVVVNDVPALVLPPEAEDLGSQISPAALPGYQTNFQLRRMAVAIAAM